MDYNSYRRQTRAVKASNITIGGTAPISVQSMTNTDTHDICATYKQCIALEDAGCDIIRITVPDIECAGIFGELRSRGVRAPLVADIHFDYKIAVASVLGGADKIRINPGNIGSRDKVKEVVRACRERCVPIRIGVNSGSLEAGILKKYGKPCAEALAESALYHASILEELDFHDIVLSVKSSSVPEMIAANRILADKTDYPLHLGVTEAGAGARATVKSSIGIGTLLSLGVGDTVRVSLTEDPVNEIAAAKSILSALHLADGGIDIVSCPTCGRTKIDLISLLSEFEREASLRGLDRLPLKVAIMGCAVNGPGEAREADIGIAGGDGVGLVFKRGEIIKKVKEDELVPELIREIENFKKTN